MNVDKQRTKRKQWDVADLGIPGDLSFYFVLFSEDSME